MPLPPPDSRIPQVQGILNVLVEKVSALPAAQRAGIEEQIHLLQDILEESRRREQQMREQTAAALEQSRAAATAEASRLQAVLEILPVGVCLIGGEGTIQQYNREFEKVWGGSPPLSTSVEGYAAYQAWWTDTGQPLRPEEWAAARAVHENQLVANQYLTIQRFDGRRAAVINSAAPIRDAQGQAVGCAVAIIDITEMINTKQALAESEKRLHIALEDSPINVFTQDRDLRYTWVFRSTPGMKVDEILGRREDEMPFLGSTAELVAAKKQVIETGRGLRREFEVLVNGREHSYLITLEPLRSERNEIIGLRGSSIETTELRALRARQMEYNTEIEVHHRLIEHREKDRQAIARDLHDGPIQSLSSTLFNIQYAKETVADPQTLEEMESIAQNVKNAIQELRQVIFELRPPSIIRFGLARTIQFHAQELQEKHPGLKVSLHLTDDANRLPEQTVLTLFRIYQEAMTNVLHHAGASRVWVRYQLKKNSLLLEIRDNGSGLPADYIVGSLTEKGHFGLAGIKERIESIQGELEVLSAPGKGTTLRVTAPV